MPGTETGQIRYLSSAVVGSVPLTIDAVRDAIEQLFAEKANGRAFNPPKLMLEMGSGHFFQSLAGASFESGVAIAKWCSAAADNPARGLPAVTATILLSDIATGQPVAIMDGNWISAVRTAGMTAVAARHLARPDSSSIGFIGCGAQALSHLNALIRVLPALSRVVACSRTRLSAERLVAEAQAVRLDAAVADEPRAAVAGMDVVVTSVPAGPHLRPFIDPTWLAPGSFTADVDLGRCWKREN
jgi:ornithine cyclodeaminase/alanine dehydrogenase